MTVENHNQQTVSCVAGILVGGHSRRMGQPKALLPLPDGRTLIEHVVTVALQVTQDVVILGESAGLPAALARLPVLPDAKPNAGPLAGLCSLLEYAQDRWALLLACDMPYLRPALIRRLLSTASPQVDAVAFQRASPQGAYHACCALYHPGILPEARDELTRGKASLQDVLARVRLAALLPDPQEAGCLTNVNTPEDHAQALRDLG